MEGATPKEPSAGIAMLTSLVSVLHAEKSEEKIWQ
jgi:ATP-dependent Lon protease